MIKIRYSDLPAGLHASARSEGRHTVIYLVPGLSATDRQAAIDRLRASARVGHSPKLPPLSLALAIIADRMSLNIRNAAAAARLHPIGAAIPVVVLAAGVILYALFVTVTIRLGPSAPQAAAAAPTPLPLSAATSPVTPGAVPPYFSGAAPTSASRLTGANSSRAASHPGMPRGQVVTATPGPSSGRTPSPAPSSSSTSPGLPSPAPSSGSPSPSPSPTRSHGGGGGSGGLCLNLILLGICVKL